jgi:hypothetical protein
MLPLLQKTWQGGTTLGGTDLVNQIISEASSEATARFVLFAIKEALKTFNLQPWTVVSSSDSVTADGTDNWATEADLVFRVLGGGIHSWIVLQQASINATTQICFDLDDILASDPNRQNLGIYFSPVDGFTGGDVSNRPTAADELWLNGPTLPWLGSMATGISCVLSCIESSDGECTRIVVSDESTGQGFTVMGIEVPHLPEPTWTDPAVAYFLGETIASGLDALRWQTMMDAEPFRARVPDLDSNQIAFSMRLTGPLRHTGEVINEISQSIHFFGGGLLGDDLNAKVDWGTLFDFYWVNRHVDGAHALYGDSFPAELVAPKPLSTQFFADTNFPVSGLEIADLAQTGLDPLVDLTLEAWVMLDDTGSDKIFIDKYQTPVGSYRLGFVSTGTLLQLDAYVAGSNLMTHSASWAPAIDTWYHVAATREKSNGELKLFVDGVEIGTTSVQWLGADLLQTAKLFRLGAGDSFSTDHEGFMADVRVWSVTRTPAEIAANRHIYLVGNEAGLEGYWPLHTNFNDLTINMNHLFAAASLGPAPALTFQDGPIDITTPPARTFVCAGDVVWGWLDDDATDLSAFNWSGKFDILPADDIAMETMLGIEGSESIDLGNLSHEWRIGLGGVNGVVDGGTLTSGIFNMGSAAGTPQYLSNSDYELGAAGREVFTIDGDDDAVATSGGQTTMVIPADPMTSTFRSFLYTIAFTPSAANDGAGIATRMLLHNREVSSIKKGWRLSYQNNNGGSPRRLVALLAFDGVVEDVMISSFTFAYDLPVFAVVVHDFADNKMKMEVAQGGTLQYDEFTMTLSGSFLANDRLVFGKSPAWHPNWGGSAYGAIAQVSTFEWDAAIPSGFTRENVKRYLQYTDGLLP